MFVAAPGTNAPQIQDVSARLGNGPKHVDISATGLTLVSATAHHVAVDVLPGGDKERRPQKGAKETAHRTTGRNHEQNGS